MKPASEPESGSNGRKGWIVVFCSSLIALSVFWSVDPSFVYFLVAVAVFSAFKILQLPSPRQEDQPEVEKSPVVQEQEYRPSEAWLFWQQVREAFKKNTSTTSPSQQGKVFALLVASFIGFMFFITILTVIFSSDSDSDGLAYRQQATDFYDRQQYDSAAFYYGLALQLDSENPDLYFERGNAFLNANKTDSALLMYDEALARNPQYSQAQYNKGYIYFDRKNYREAIDEAKKVMEYAPDYTDAMLLIGDSFYNQSQLDSALNWYEDAYAQGYRSAILCHLMAYIYDTKGNTATAISLYKEAVTQDSTIKSIYVRLGELVPGEEGNRYRQKASQMPYQIIIFVSVHSQDRCRYY